MSGIAGIVHFDRRPIEPGLIESMTQTMQYRGPDGIAHWRQENAAFGHCALHATVEALSEVQPLVSERGDLLLVMDGRVDNGPELRDELLPVRQRSQPASDAQLVLWSFERWGVDCALHIDGDFAFAVWNAKTQTLFCARDRFGNKPFHYHWDGTTLSFASDVRPLLNLAWVPRRLNETLVAEFLAAEWYSQDTTFWQDISRLPEAHCLTVSAGGRTLRQYWEPNLDATLVYASDEEYVEHYRALLRDAVRRCTRSHRPVACEVSGGLDSSAIFAVAEAMHKAGGLGAPGLDGYTLDFSGDPAADELRYARAVGQHCGRPVHEVKPELPPLAWYTERAARWLDFPDYPHGAMQQAILDRARAAGSRVILSGTGGDEWLDGGDERYVEAWDDRHVRSLYRFLREEAVSSGAASAIWHLARRGVAPKLPEPIKRVLRVARNPFEGVSSSHKYWLAPRLARLLETLRQHDATTPRPAVNRRSQRRLAQLLRYAYGARSREFNERRCAAMQMEWRQPLFDRRIVEFAFATPDHLRARAGTSKWLHRRAMTGLLPRSLLERETKAEFSVAFLQYWPELEGRVGLLLAQSNNSWVDTTSTRGMFERAPQHPQRHWTVGIIWALVALDATCCPSASVSDWRIR